MTTSRKHRIASIVFGVVVGLGVAVLSYRWISDPAQHEERRQQERVVHESRAVLSRLLAVGSLEIVDPLAPNRRVGKVYVYPVGDGWEVSGYYRRGDGDRWHPYLMKLDEALVPTQVKLADTDPALVERAATDPILDVRP